MKWHQINIYKHLNDLLYLHDFVIVPNFGAFVTNYKPAEITENNYILPPSKSISFNSSLTASDGLFISYLSSKLNIEQADAKELVSGFVRDIFIDLDNKKQIVFENLGSFEFDKNLNLIFEPKLKLNLLADAYGFSSIHYPKLEKPSKRIEKEIKDKARVKKLLTSRVAKLTYIILPILIFISVLTTQINIIDKSDYNYSDFSDIVSSDNSNKAKSRVEKELDSITKKENALMYVEIIEPKSSENIKKEIDIKPITKLKSNKQRVITRIKLANSSKITENTKEKISKTEIKKFYLVVGSFSEKRNAKNFIAKLKNKGIDAVIVNNKGKFRVSAGSFDTKTMAKKKVSVLKKRGIKTWISKRK